MYSLFLFNKREDDYDEKYKKLSFEEEIDKLHKLIMEKDRLKIIEYLEILFDKNELSTKNIFDLSVKIFLLMDKISYEFKINNVVEDSLISNIIKLFNEKSRENIKYFIILEVDNLLKIMNANTEKFSHVIQQIVIKVKISLKRRLKALKNVILGKGISQNENDPQYLIDVHQMKKQYAELLENFYNTPMAEMYIRTKVSQLEEEFGSEEQFRQIDSSKLEQWKELLLESYRMDMDFISRVYKDGCEPMQEQYKKYLEKMGVDDVDITNEHGKSYFVKMMCSDVNITELALKGSDQLVYEIFVASTGLFADEHPDNGSEVKLVK